MTPSLADLDPGLEGFVEGEYVGNPMYAVVGEHTAAMVSLLFVPIVMWLAILGLRLAAGRGHVWAGRLLGGYRSLPSVRRVLVWLLVASGLVHLALVAGHEFSGYSILFLGAGVAMLAIARQLTLGKSWRRWAAALLLGSILAYSVSVVSGEPPDQLGLATKLLELVALALVLTPRTRRRFRRALASVAVTTLVLFTGTAAWIGAFSTAGAEGGHHGGEFPEPGTVVPYIADRPATGVEAAAADDLYLATSAAIQRYQDPAVAAADGYQTDGMIGTDFHARNEAYVNDGRVLDPERPENLVYAVTSKGPVLLGAMFEIPEIGVPGPQVGGPLTVWHSHENVCFSLLPLVLSGLVSPFGGCAVGSLALPVTGEMIHVWTVPGAPDKIGHLDDEWVIDFLAQSS